MDLRPKTISKQLSMNDTGETGGHQAGMLIPKTGDVLKFFPLLDSTRKNPRVSLYFTDINGKVWRLCFIYYNNKFFGGTRNEYRLTGMTAFFRQANLKTGDIVFLTRDDNQLSISYRRSTDSVIRTCEAGKGQIKKVLVLGNGWKVIDY